MAAIDDIVVFENLTLQDLKNILDTYAFDTKPKRASSCFYLKNLLTVTLTLLYGSQSYPHYPIPKFNGLNPLVSAIHQICLSWKNFSLKLEKVLSLQYISTWSLEEINIWWILARLIHKSITDFSIVCGLQTSMTVPSSNDTLENLFRIFELAISNDLIYSSNIYVDPKELNGEFQPRTMQEISNVLSVIDGKVMLNSVKDFNYLLGIEDFSTMEFSDTRVMVNSVEVIKMKETIVQIQQSIENAEQILLQLHLLSDENKGESFVFE
ncbi:26474_t:CDS:1 [Dentiscutata erythropus]|uniref:26474_t:CDS:1 n=1 Tax=Dentiscutata erythropus TaxID=1348616 RepID=A0A9N9EPQ3_9GLOM|nr:26474_t:CDS:1 [Dentiscutata erythropus]